MANEYRPTITRQHIGPRMSKIVRCNGLVFLCGQTASGSEAVTIEEQTVEALRRTDELLAQAGTDRSRLLAVTVHLRSMSDFAHMNACWERWLEGVGAPARTTVEAALASEHLLVEFTVTAAA